MHRTVAFVSALSGFTITMTELEQWLRVATAAVALLVAIVTLIGHLRKHRNDDEP